MADSAVNNAKACRFEDAGIARHDYGGGTEYITQQVVPGTMSVSPGGRARILDVDRGGLRADIREGDEQPTEITYRAKYTGEVGANDLITRSKAESASTGVVPKFDFEMDIPDARGASTGTRVVFTDCVFARPVTISEGAEFAEMEIALLSTDHLGTDSTY